MKNVAVFLADGFEEVEAFTPIDYLRRAKANVITVGVKGMNEYIGEKKTVFIVTSSHGIPVIADISLSEFLKKYNEDSIDMLFCPGGGKGAENLANCVELLEFIEKMHKKGKFVSAICASPAVVLGKTSAPKGSKWTCYPNMQNESDTSFIPNYVDKPFVTDGNLITGRAAGSSEQFAMELIRLLFGENSAEQIKKATCQR